MGSCGVVEEECCTGRVSSSHQDRSNLRVTANFILQYFCRGILLNPRYNYHRDGAGKYRRGARELLAVAMDRPGLSLNIYE